MKYLILFAATGVFFLTFYSIADRIKSIKLLLVFGMLSISFVIVSYLIFSPWFNAN
jgi:hypothetical protein